MDDAIEYFTTYMAIYHNYKVNMMDSNSKSKEILIYCENWELAYENMIK